jgi:hypothetical protein
MTVLAKAKRNLTDPSTIFSLRVCEIEKGEVRYSVSHSAYTERPNASLVERETPLPSSYRWGHTETGRSHKSTLGM